MACSATTYFDTPGCRTPHELAAQAELPREGEGS